MATVYAYGNRISYSQSSDCECNTSSSIGLTLSKRDMKSVIPELLSTLTIEEVDIICDKAVAMIRKREAEDAQEKVVRNK